MTNDHDALTVIITYLIITFYMHDVHALGSNKHATQYATGTVLRMILALVAFF